MIRRVLDAIAVEHRQILKLLYGDDYSAAEIMHLLRIERGQWDGRRRRALLAFVRALARHDLTPQCAHARKLLKHDPHQLMAGLDADGHFDSCLPCRAFQHSTKSALAVMPLPIAIPAIKFDTLDYFTRKSESAAGSLKSTPGPGVADSFAALKSSLGYKLAFAAVTGTLAVAGVVGAFVAHNTSATLSSELSTYFGRDADQARWAAHETERQALERAARDFSRNRTP